MLRISLVPDAPVVRASIDWLLLQPKFPCLGRASLRAGPEASASCGIHERDGWGSSAFAFRLRRDMSGKLRRGLTKASRTRAAAFPARAGTVKGVQSSLRVKVPGSWAEYESSPGPSRISCTNFRWRFRRKSLQAIELPANLFSEKLSARVLNLRICAVSSPYFGACIGHPRRCPTQRQLADM